MIKQLFAALTEFQAPLATSLFAMIGCGFFTTYISIIYERHHYNLLQIGLIQSAFFTGLLLGAWKIQKIIYHVGHIQSLSALGSLGVIAILLQGVFPFFPVWILTRFCSGISISAIYVCVEGWILEHSKPKERGVALALYMVTLSTGYALGQKVIPILDLQSLIPFQFTALFAAMSIIPVSLSTKKILVKPYEDFLRFDKLFKTSQLGCSACLISGLLISASFSFLPVYGTYARVSSFDAVFYFVIGGLVLLWPLGKLSDHFDRRKVLFFLGILLSLTSVFLLMNKNTAPQLTSLSICIYGGLCYALYPIGLTLACERLSFGSLTQAASSILIFYGVGCAFGPLTTSILMNVFGVSGLFLFTIVLSTGFSAFVIFLIQKGSQIPKENQLDFIAIPSTTPTAVELNPALEKIDEKRSV